MDPLPDFLTRTESGGIRLSGTRVGLEHVLEHHQNGETIDQMREWFPHVSHDHVRRVLDHYQAHRVAVDEYLRQCNEQYERLLAASRPLDKEAMRKRFAVKQAEWDRRRVAGLDPYA